MERSQTDRLSYLVLTVLTLPLNDDDAIVFELPTTTNDGCAV
jgi:hypothetical protein